MCSVLYVSTAEALMHSFSIGHLIDFSEFSSLQTTCRQCGGAVIPTLQVTLLFLTFWADRLLHLPSAEAMSVRANARPQKVTVTKGHVNDCEAVDGCGAEIGIKARD